MGDQNGNGPRLTLRDEEWAAFSESVVSMLRACHELDIGVIQLMILYAVQAATKRRMPFDKQSIAKHIGRPRQTVYRQIADLEQRGLLRTERRGHQDFVYLVEDAIDFEQCVCALGIAECARVLLATGNPAVRELLGLSDSPQTDPAPTPPANGQALRPSVS
ncbi:MAG: helix-turn-helix domain-containing protein [Alphaproteobacteria bacterium]|nr:helix-turn-helix domain-containing protein [Alphaproteobacteria bacterium]